MMSFCALLEGCIHYESIGLRVNRDDTTLNPRLFIRTSTMLLREGGRSPQAGWCPIIDSRVDLEPWKCARLRGITARFPDLDQ